MSFLFLKILCITFLQIVIATQRGHTTYCKVLDCEVQLTMQVFLAMKELENYKINCLSKCNVYLLHDLLYNDIPVPYMLYHIWN